MQMKIKMRYHLIPAMMLIIKKWMKTSIDKDVEILESLYAAAENIKWYRCCEKQCGGFTHTQKQ